MYDFLKQFKSTINKIRSNKIKATNFSDDIDFEDTVDSFKRRNRASADYDADDSYGKSASSIKKSSFKVYIFQIQFFQSFS